MEFIAVSDYLKRVKEVAEKSGRLKISIYIWGEEGTGKSHLARYISHLAPIKPVIVEEEELAQLTPKPGSFIVATGRTPFSSLPQQRLFEIDLHLLPLSHHPEDIPAFIDHFRQEGERELKLRGEVKIERPDLSQNLHSLKRQVYRHLLAPRSLSELEECAFQFYLNSPHFSWQELERTFLKGILEGAKTLYPTKMEMSKRLKFNRVTLIRRLKELFDE
jgi:transcriptional regulator with AAA-type ATPase domain